MVITIDEMAKVGMHFGHQSRKWNPKMAPYIYTERNGIHIIDLIQTYSHLRQVKKFLVESSGQGKTFLFVGTKKQVSRLIAKTALQSNSFFVNQRWLGGMLTNWQTIKMSIAKLNELEIREKNGELRNLPKKEAAASKKEKERLLKYLGGLKNMVRVPDIAIIIGQPEEMNAVAECRKLGIKTVTILDTDCNPSLADYFVPANDDSVGAVQLLLNEFLQSIQEGQQKYFEKQKKVENQKRLSKNPKKYKI